jgi:hypothetical protein
MLSSVTADGDTEIVAIVKAMCPKGNVTINHDPNHYTKGLTKHMQALCNEHPALNTIIASLKSHFLIGVKKHKKNEHRFITHILHTS